MSLNKMRFKIIGLILLIGISIGFGGIVASDNRPPIGQAPPINDTTSPESIAASENEAPQKYTVTASSVETVNTSQLQKYGEVGTQAGERIEVTMSPTNVAAVENISWVTNVRPVIKSKSTNIPGSSDGESLGVQQAHQNGITGEGVKVGIIDDGFDTDNPAISSNIVDTKSFREIEGDPAHGTSVAETVVRTAPDSQLYVTTTSTGTDTEAAINYLSGQNVDIIVYSAGFPVIDDDGKHFLTDDITKATKNGTLFVNSAGNNAQLHWEGNFRDSDLDDIHEWSANGDEQSCIPNCNSRYSGDIEIFIRWNNTENPQSHYRPLLYNPIAEEYIAVDTDGVDRTGFGTSYTRLSGRITQSQAVDLVVDRVEGSPNDEIEIIVAGPQEIEHNIPSSSITAPGDVSEALTVAAYQRGISRGLDGQYPRQLASYSSRGPIDDGRTGIDVAGYTNIRTTNNFYNLPFPGTSAAAPYVGGVAALVHEKQPTDPSPTELTNTLKSSSDDILDPGIDTSSGSGVVNANEAIKNTESAQVQLRNAELSQNSISNNSESDRTLTFDALNVSSDDQQDNFTVTMPQSVELVAVTDVAVTNGNYDVSYSKNGNAIQFHVDPNRDVANVDLTFEADMTLTGRG
jgi:hypothetical protein